MKTTFNEIDAESINLFRDVFSNAEQELIPEPTIPELFFNIATSYPDNIAVICGSESLTYQQLANHSLDLSAYLQSKNLALDECVGVFAEPSLDLMISILGILAAGSAYLPLSPEYPEARIEWMLADSKTKIIFTQEKWRQRLNALAQPGTLIFTLEDVQLFSNQNTNLQHFKVNPKLRPQNLAYVIYTSGSTGKPKGVMIEHHSIVNQMHWLEQSFNLKQSIILQKTPMSFDAAQWEILSLCYGSRVIMGNPELHKNPEELIKAIIEYKVNILQCVPTLLQALLDNDKFKDCVSLKQVFSGGEILTRDLALLFFTVLPNASLINLYGPTECTINASFFIVSKPSLAESSNNAISIGIPISNMQYYILDNRLAPVEPGHMGELYLGGAGLARGYLNQPQLTQERFIQLPGDHKNKMTTIYKTGDLVCKNVDGTLHYAGRIDNQVKLRGYRIELDEIRLAIEEHAWVKHAAVILKNDPVTNSQNLIAFTELNPKEAALMDQGNHGSHHQSKASKAQVLMQLSNQGCREIEPNTTIIDLPNLIPNENQIKKVFARKTYRFYNGGQITKADILNLLKNSNTSYSGSGLEDLSFEKFGEILRYFGQFVSEKRFLPKYAYASPGALYATQLYLELNKVGNLPSGLYYYHPLQHKLLLVCPRMPVKTTEIKLHFIGKKSAIEPIYKNNIQEVLEIETGHMVGLFDVILPEYGLQIIPDNFQQSIKQYLQVADEDYYLGSFKIVSGTPLQATPEYDLYLQIHPGKGVDLPAGTYHYTQGNLVKISNDMILRKEVIAINQEVYNRSSFGITVISKPKEKWLEYIILGQVLQTLQMNPLQIGLMSSGYSSKTGNALPSSIKIEKILGNSSTASYFFIGGMVSQEQIASQGMDEDIVHMKGPAEMIHDDLVKFLPSHMIPNQVIVLNKMPLTVNGKIDFQELHKENIEIIKREYIPPRTLIEQKICTIWEKEMKRSNISVNDSFFVLGGNSLMAVSIINKINKQLHATLSLQVLFEFPTIEKIAIKMRSNTTDGTSRLLPLQKHGFNKPIYCWPGLGGYCMNLRLLAETLGTKQPFYGIQAFGINRNEIPFTTIEEMAVADIKLIKGMQPSGPYTLWGYSFGARVAFEVAYQLEKMGDKVENLVLIAPGTPALGAHDTPVANDTPTFDNPAFITILFSVFMGNINSDLLGECLKTVNDKQSFADFIMQVKPVLDAELIDRIINIVLQTYGLRHSLKDLENKRLNTSMIIVGAKGDNKSIFEENCSVLYRPCAILRLDIDHYSLLRENGVASLINSINQQLTCHVASLIDKTN